MDIEDFQRTLLVHALHVIACDGEIDSREVEEIRRLTATTPHFSEIDTEQELTVALKHLRENGAVVIDEALTRLSSAVVTHRQSLKLLEVLLQVVHADDLVHEAERAYLQRTREALGLDVGEVAEQFTQYFSIFVRGSGSNFQEEKCFQLPASLPDASEFTF
jgi:uncharacterized tellurite resistance protein B-like protein